MSDLIIIGIGPAGVSAALYAVRAGLSPVVIGGENTALALATHIQNYYGLPGEVSGSSLFDAGIRQLEELKVSTVRAEVVDIQYGADGLYSVLSAEATYQARCVILATGAGRERVKLEGFDRLDGHGVSWCAVCDGFFFRGKDVAVLGSGLYALHEAEYLLPLARSVKLLTNGDAPPAGVPATVQVVTAKLNSLLGESTLEGAAFEDGTSLPLSGLFVALGIAGASALARKLGAPTSGGNVVVDETCSTLLPGLFAAGDCTGGMPQVTAAVYQGARAAPSAIAFLRETR